MSDLARLVAEAAALRQAGRWAEAEAAYARALAINPDMPESWFNLGVVRRRRGRFEEALAAYAEAIARGVREPEEAHLNRAVIYSDHLRDETSAERELQAALTLNPSYAPALFNLANLREERGRLQEAQALYERVLSVAPEMHEALARLGQLAPRAACDEALIARLRAVLARNDVSPPDRASLGFALGRVLDVAERYDEAFAAYAAANAASRASAGRPVQYDRAGHERLIDQLIATFSAPARASASVKAPIFICGMFRSGSTLAEQVLAGHPRVTAGGELPLLAQAVRALGDYPRAAAALSPEASAGLARRYADGVAKLFANADLVTDKRPDNYLHIGLIKTLFPDARIVHTTRDPLDNCLSVYFLHLDHSMSYALDLGDIAHHYRQYRRLMAHWKALYGADILDFDYDAFVSAPEQETRALLEFLGLDWDPACLDFHRRANAVKTASVWQVREPLYRRASGRWRHYQRQLGPLIGELGDLTPTDM